MNSSTVHFNIRRKLAALSTLRLNSPNEMEGFVLDHFEDAVDHSTTWVFAERVGELERENEELRKRLREMEADTEPDDYDLLTHAVKRRNGELCNEVDRLRRHNVELIGDNTSLRIEKDSLQERLDEALVDLQHYKQVAQAYRSGTTLRGGFIDLCN